MFPAHTPVADCRFCAIDFESAGTHRGSTDAPIQIGIATSSPPDHAPETFVSYLHTDQPIQWSAQRVHGITPAHLTESPTLASLWPEIKSRMHGAVIIAHGKGTEKRFLRAFPGHAFGPWIDTLLLARAAWPELPDHGLGAVCEANALTPAIESIAPGKSWHDALFDAAASLVLLHHLVGLWNLRDHPIDILTRPDTSAWHRLRAK